ncbi:putative Zinc metalloproteinase nas-14 [Hypsibius exemplaris]|uniref:Metalloendopeptidase n=1 Tax=Hypsibius exemplaris TaxID=2072580 RepID=A0A9X6NHB2_HYPEX|nr:putative Zinc metalloproteinase nas-14 [Hypsibius exemplaris]
MDKPTLCLLVVAMAAPCITGAKLVKGQQSVPRPTMTTEGLISDKLWPGGVVPFVFSKAYSREDQARQLVLKAMAGFENSTCIRFVPRTTEKDFVIINSGIMKSCSAYIGNQHLGSQQILLNPASCFPNGNIGVAQHQLMHTLGFGHEQSRSDRDQFVDINWSNVAQANDSFPLSTEDTTFGEPYDFDSIMHAGMFENAIDKSIWTVRPKEKYRDKVIGQSIQLSGTDIRKINKMYKCPGHALPVPVTTADTKPDLLRKTRNSA